uniref:Uncharacterized protein n=1 Tax=Arundo donax TaxID=35708 RepID=A0A0A9E1P9_ARUDO
MISRRQEQNPGRVSHCARAASAGRRDASSALSELTRTVHMVGTSPAESAISLPTRRRPRTRGMGR